MAKWQDPSERKGHVAPGEEKVHRIRCQRCGFHAQWREWVVSVQDGRVRWANNRRENLDMHKCRGCE